MKHHSVVVVVKSPQVIVGNNPKHVRKSWNKKKDKKKDDKNYDGIIGRSYIWHRRATTRSKARDQVDTVDCQIKITIREKNRGLHQPHE